MKTATARFSQVVDRAGRPTNHLVFAAPEKDAVLQSAIRSERVMTIHQEHVGAHKDFGMVGFDPAPHSQILIFARSLKAFAGKRVVGIDFDLVAEAPPLPRPKPRRASRRRSRAIPPGSRLSFNSFAKRTPHPTSAPAPTPIPARTPPGTAAATRDVRSDLAPAPTVRSESALRRAVQLAVNELKAGKAVAAHARLQAALKDTGA